jgi:hypothetical protein
MTQRQLLERRQAAATTSCCCPVEILSMRFDFEDMLGNGSFTDGCWVPFPLVCVYVYMSYITEIINHINIYVYMYIIHARLYTHRCCCSLWAKTGQKLVYQSKSQGSNVQTPKRPKVMIQIRTTTLSLALQCSLRSLSIRLG